MSRRPVVEGHRVPARLLDETFAGPVSGSTMAELRRSQHSRRVLLLKVVLELAPDSEAAWRALVAADEADPDAVRQVLAYPAVGTWLVRAIRRARGYVSDSIPAATEMAYLGSVAAAAAVRAGVPASLDVPVWHGRVNLPTIGQYETGDGTMARLQHTGTETHLQVDGVGPVSLGELTAVPLRCHRSRTDGVAVSWTVDDIDPYRAFSTVEPAARLDRDEYGRWCDLLDEAWELLVRRQPGYAAELAFAAPVIVPVSPSRGVVASSSSSSFGAIVVAPPDSGADLAEKLVHELQHSKLNAVLDLVRLDDAPDRLGYAPWRRDPRPLTGLLHGIYAFMSGIDFWHGQRRDSEEAAFHFLRHREQVRTVAAQLAGAPGLTEFGRRLVDAVLSRLDRCAAETVSDEVAETVALLLAEQRLSWRLRHLVPPADHVEELAERWLAGGTPTEPRDSALVPDSRPESGSSLPALLMAKGLGQDGVAAVAARPGELALVEGRRAEAVRLFSTRIAADADDDGAWIGLLAALRHGADDRTAVETVAATYRRLGTDVDPVALVDWFADRPG